MSNLERGALTCFSIVEIVLLASIKGDSSTKDLPTVKVGHSSKEKFINSKTVVTPDNDSEAVMPTNT